MATFVKQGMTADAKEGLGIKEFDQEGRTVRIDFIMICEHAGTDSFISCLTQIITDHQHFVLFNVYVPNGGSVS